MAKLPSFDAIYSEHVANIRTIYPQATVKYRIANSGIISSLKPRCKMYFENNGSLPFDKFKSVIDSLTEFDVITYLAFSMFNKNQQPCGMNVLVDLCRPLGLDPVYRIINHLSNNKIITSFKGLLGVTPIQLGVIQGWLAVTDIKPL